MLCHIPALSILSEFHIGQWFYAPEEITVLAHYVADTVENVEIGSKVDVNIEYSNAEKTFAEGTWNVTRLQISDDVTVDNTAENTDKDETNVVDVERRASQCDGYVALNVISCIARTDFHMYLVVEIVDWTSPDAKLKVQFPKQIPLRGSKVRFTFFKHLNYLV